MSRPTILPLWLYAALGVCLAAALYSGRAFGEPRFEAATKDRAKVVTLYSEPCALPAVKNLPGRATWDEKGKRFEGCYARDPDLEILLFYFEDLSVLGIVQDAFKPIVKPPAPGPST